MAISYTSRRDMDHAPFRWQCAGLVAWLGFSLFVTHRFPADSAVLLFLLPTLGFIATAFFPGAGFDFQGVVFSGSFFCSHLTPALFTALRENHPFELMSIIFSILFAMVFGFAFFRLMGKVFQRMM